MSAAGPATPRAPRDRLALAGYVALCLVVSGIGARATTSSVGTWYQALEKPWFTPPDWLFAPVWTALYVLMAVAAWRVHRRRGAPGRPVALAAFAVQLALNLAWSFLFFGLRSVEAGMAGIVALLGAIVWTIVAFAAVDRPAAWLLAPYLCWVGFATALNAGILALL